MRALLCVLVLVPSLAAAQSASPPLAQRGFVEGAVFVFPQDATNDRTHVVGDLLVRDELFYTPAGWIQLAAGLDVRADTHDQVASSWKLDYSDRGVQRPRLSVRRLSATLTHGRFTLDLGKQFLRWGKTDIVTPTDHFAPRDFLNVVDSEFLAVSAVRAVVQAGADTVEGVWVPRFTPSRIPLLTERWTVLPASAAAVPIVDEGVALPSGSQVGARWSHVGDGLEYSLSYFDGFNNLPDIHADVRVFPAEVDLTRSYPAIRSYGGDLAVPTPWLTLKVESAYVTSSSPTEDEYGLYVAQVERQTGEWLLLGGYAGEVVTRSRSALTFAPDRGLSRAFVGRASYTIDTNRSFTIEGAARQNGGGVYAKGEYSQAGGQHWRTTLDVVAIGGHSDDFLGQYHRNSHATVTLRYSF